MNADRSNYALISALYASKTRGLYSDIYFPIIKYAILKIYNDDDSSEHYTSSEVVAEKIFDLFGIKIPNVVIAKTVKKISLQTNTNIMLNVYSDGLNFQIVTARFDEDENAYIDKERDFNIHLHEIETEYQEFTKREGTYDEGVTFTQFITQNTENILGYFENEKEERLEEKYATMAFFLDFLQRQKRELFEVANQLFWSSVIAAFLQSERPQVNEEAKGQESEYYLDTPLVMSGLDLSTQENAISAKDVCDVITSAGGILRVHPATMEEIKTILTSVAQNGPNPGTSIANACDRRQLLAPQITKIMLNLQKQVTDLGIQVFPASMPDCRRTIMEKYKGKPVLKQLAELRNNSSEPFYYGSDNFREAHDIFMDDYIGEQRKQKRDKQNIYFLTTNTDLVEFCRRRHEGQNNMLSTGKVILEMWMHNAQPAKVSSCALTETMARCLDLHRSQVRTKLHVVARYFNSTKEDVAPEVYNEFLRLLYRRARHVVTAVEQAPEGDPKEYLKVLQKAITQDNSHFESINSDISSLNSDLNAQIAKSNEKVAMLSDESEMKSREIGGLQAKYEDMTMRKERLEHDLEDKARALADTLSEAETQRTAKQAMIELNNMYIRKDELRSKLEKVKDELGPLSRARKRSARDVWPFFIRFYGLGCLCIPIAKFILEKVGQGPEISLSDIIIYCSIGLAFIVCGFVMSIEKFSKQRKTKAIAKWERDNPRYFELLKEKESLEDDLNFVGREIKNSTSPE